MCGINGLVKANKADIKRMNQCLVHRGPDQEGVYLDKEVGLGFRRLAIIDLSSKGNQPMEIDGGSLIIVYNGEIYNYQELRSILEKEFKFNSKTDTEAILWGYKKWGKEVLGRLNGMFAFAIYDKKNKKIFCARDRFGEKPLYFRTDPYFAFASEIKSLLTLGKGELDLERLNEFLTFENTLTKKTLFQGIFELLPAHLLEFSLASNDLKIEKYWELEFKTDQTKSKHQWEEEILVSLKESVESKLVGDVPIGTYLSGGLDSSAITAFASKKLPYKTHSFCLVFNEEGVLSEKKYMDSFLSRFSNVQNHFVSLDAKKYWSSFVECTWMNDYPLVFPAQVAQYVLAREARKYITVVLSGEGGDEVFGGYNRHLTKKNANGVGGGRNSFRFFKLLQALALIRRKNGNYYINLKLSPEISQAMTINYFYSSRKKQLYGKKMKQFSGLDIISEVERNTKGDRDYLSKFLVREINSYLRTLLHKQDRMNMAASIESRVPFLDYKFVEKFLSIPQRFKISSKEGKIILKEALREVLPREILERKKEGFTLPIKSWLEEVNWGKKILSSSKLAEDEVLNQKEIERFISKKDSKGVYFLLALEIWYRIFIKNENRKELSL